MKHLTRKLHSNRGSSMILALVFLMFCIFVGGSVLAVATANSARIQHQTESEQQFLRQRSAVRLMQEGMTQGEQPTIRLSVHIITTTTQKVKILNGGGLEYIGTPTSSLHFTFSGPVTNEKKPAAQRLVYESAIYRVLDMYNYVASDTMAFTNLEFLSLDGRTSEALYYRSSSSNNFWLSGATGNQILISDPVDPSVNLNAQVICSGGTSPYNFWITFGENGQNAQVSMKMQATVSERPSQQSAPYYVDDPSSSDERIQFQKTDTTQTITITWIAPEIVKGGIN